MDREKINKAAGDNAEIAFAKAVNAPWPETKQEFAQSFKAGADWLTQQPLSERLTDEEKEKIMQVYRQASCPSNRATYTGRAVLRLFPSIFGSDLFNEK